MPRVQFLDRISSMTSSYLMRLMPDGQTAPGEQVKTIEIFSNSTTPTCLGRNIQTNITSSKLSRKLCDVVVTDSGEMFLTMKKNPGEHHVMINDIKVTEPPGVQIPIYRGSIVSLYQNKFRYTVDLLDTKNQSPFCIPNGTPAVVTTAQNKSSLNEECMCSICIEVIVDATVINPCGHVFCKKCIENYRRRSNQCPNCRCHIRNLVSVQYTDNIIFGLLKKGEFEKDDAMDFLKRSGKRLSEDEMKTMNSIIEKRRKCRDDHELEPTTIVSGAAIVPVDTENGRNYTSLSGKSLEDAICID